MGNCIKMELPAVYFEEAFPIGNGFLGGMYYGGADSGKVSLNLDSLWSGNGKYKGKTNAAQYFPELLDLVKDNKKSEAVDLLKKHFYGNDSEGFLPLGNLFVTSPEYSEFRNYERELDFNEGTAKSSYIQDANSVNEKIFCSYPDRALIYRIECKNSSLIRRIKFEPSFQCNVKYDCGKILCDGACPDGCNPIKITGNNGTIRYGCAFKIITDGCAENSDGISISGASYIEVRFSGSTSFYETDILAKKVYERLESISENYEEIYVRHIDDFKCLYNKSSLTLNGDEFADRKVRKRL
jgi:alpha-L-fucosidase 2